MKPKSLLLAGVGTIALLGLSAVQTQQVTADIAQIGVTRRYFVKLEDGSSKTRARFLSGLKALTGNQAVVEREFDNVFAGYQVQFDSRLLAKVGAIPGVSNVFGSTKYAMPDDTIALGSPVSGESPISSHSLETLGLTEAQAKATAQGAGVTIGILDTGLFSTQVGDKADETSPKAFRPLDDKGAAKARFKSEKDIDPIKAGTDFIGKTARFINDKIPFAYDYAGGDDNVQATYVNDHGTHVASLAAANGATYQGIAPEAQLAILKVFADDSGSAYTETILAAMEDAAALGLDIVNLSLGSGLIQYQGLQDKESAEAQAVEGLRSKGVIVNFAAGNDGRSSWDATSGFFADKVTTETVEPSEFGSYALFDNVNIVASSTLDKVNADALILPDKTALAYRDMNTAAPLVSSDKAQAGLTVVKVPNVGAEEDYNGISVDGALAVINRGEITFVDKIANAIAHGAAAIAIVNTDDTLVNFAVPAGVAIPVIQLTLSQGKALPDKAVVHAANEVEVNALARHVSTFSSDGPATDLDFNPDIAAPGDGTLGAVLHGYEEMSGTSMATPNLSGALAVILSQFPDQGKETFSAIKKTVMAKLQSTANPLVDDSDAQPEDELNYASPRRQGAGLADIHDAVNAKVWAETEGDDGTPSGKAKLEFKTDAEFSKGIISPKFTLTNETASDVSYDAKVYVAVPEVRKGVSDAEWEVGKDYLNPNLRTTDLQTADDHAIGVYELPDPITVKANSTQDASFSFDANKDIEGKAGALQDYVDQYYPDGTYLEGYVILTPTGASKDVEGVTELNIPYMGFFGDYGKAPAAEAFDFEKEDGVAYNSDIQSSVLQNLSGGFPNADFGSRLYALSSTSEAGVSALDQPGYYANLFAKDLPENQTAYGVTPLGFDASGKPETPTAGVTNASDVLLINQFMNRSAIYGKVDLVSPDKSIVQSTYLSSYPYSGTGDPDSDLSNANAGNGYPGNPLMKSFVTQTGLQSGFGLPTAAAALPLTTKEGDPLAPGHYSLQFHYLLEAADEEGNHYEQVKEVPLDIAEKSEVSYLGFEATGTAFRIYVSDDTVTVTDRVNQVIHQVVEENGRRYADIPVYAAKYGIILVNLTSAFGEVKTLAINTKTPNGDALIGETAVDVYNGITVSGDLFYFTSKVNDKEGKNADITVHVDDKSASDDNAQYVAKPHGFALDIGADKAIDKVQYIDPKSGNPVDFSGSVTYSYDPVTGLLTVEGLPEEVITIRIILK